MVFRSAIGFCRGADSPHAVGTLRLRPLMGRPMARNLMQHGHEMGVYTRRPESATPLIEAGARRYDTPAPRSTTTPL